MFDLRKRLDFQGYVTNCNERYHVSCEVAESAYDFQPRKTYDRLIFIFILRPIPVTPIRSTSNLNELSDLPADGSLSSAWPPPRARELLVPVVPRPRPEGDQLRAPRLQIRPCRVRNGEESRRTEGDVPVRGGARRAPGEINLDRCECCAKNSECKVSVKSDKCHLCGLP
jgi:hypothetical protein